MDLDQRAAERAFRKWGKPATYDDGSGAEPIECRLIPDKSIDDFADDRVRTPRDEFSLLISEVGSHSPDALISFNSVEHKVRSCWKMMASCGGCRWTVEKYTLVHLVTKISSSFFYFWVKMGN
ncbi:hypothetical protein Misp06_03096 [Microbulbifer sp. NBRC 101763]|uniref:hypothetical protein n=1 Tax=Microbulbifer sp. NBRC 101763 TaxID=1113820 RepID=UPI0030B52CD9